MKRMIIVTGALLVALVGLLLVRTMLYTPPSIKTAEAVAFEVDVDSVAAHLSEAITYQTISLAPPAHRNEPEFDAFLAWATLGVLLGGRLGYVLFYRPGYFLENPAEIPQVWTGGMSFHGGLLGVIIAALLFCRARGLSRLAFGDMLGAVAPVGLFFGRIANFINGELWGRPGDVPWAMVFPRADDQPRHPSQLYEALLEGLVLFIVAQVLIRRFNALERPGLIMGTFIAGYGAARFIVEFFRQWDAGLEPLFGLLSRGQQLSLPMILIGLYFVWQATRKSGGARS